MKKKNVVNCQCLVYTHATGVSYIRQRYLQGEDSQLPLHLLHEETAQIERHVVDQGRQQFALHCPEH
jgi:hypothetical protein